MSFGKSFCWKNQMLCRNATVLSCGAKVHDKADTHLSTGQWSWKRHCIGSYVSHRKLWNQGQYQLFLRSGEHGNLGLVKNWCAVDYPIKKHAKCCHKQVRLDEFAFASFSGILRNFQDILGLKIRFCSSLVELLMWKSQVNIAVFSWIYGGFTSEIMDCNCAISAEGMLS